MSTCSRTYTVDSYLVNRQGRLGLYFLLNLIQDMSVVHAIELGHGRDETLKRNGFWVLTRQKVVMREWPKRNEQLTIRTWFRPASGAFLIRDFEISLGGEVVGESTISYVLLNTDTRKPMTSGADALDHAARRDGQATIDSIKVPAQTAVETIATFEVRNSDLDVNNHVNNTRYAQWILDAVPIDLHSKVLVREYDVNFIAETKLGDVIEIQTPPASAINDALAPRFFQGRRTRDQKVVFTALMKTNAAGPSVG